MVVLVIAVVAVIVTVTVMIEMLRMLAKENFLITITHHLRQHRYRHRDWAQMISSNSSMIVDIAMIPCPRSAGAGAFCDTLRD